MNDSTESYCLEDVIVYKLGMLKFVQVAQLLFLVSFLWDSNESMEISEKAKELIKELGFDLDTVFLDDDLHVELWNNVSTLLQIKGFDWEYEVTETGILCEEILDYLADMDECSFEKGE